MIHTAIGLFQHSNSLYWAYMNDYLYTKSRSVNGTSLKAIKSYSLLFRIDTRSVENFIARPIRNSASPLHTKWCRVANLPFRLAFFDDATLRKSRFAFMCVCSVFRVCLWTRVMCAFKMEQLRNVREHVRINYASRNERYSSTVLIFSIFRTVFF